MPDKNAKKFASLWRLGYFPVLAGVLMRWRTQKWLGVRGLCVALLCFGVANAEVHATAGTGVINTLDYGTGLTSGGAHCWRGYAFKVAVNTTMTHIVGGADNTSSPGLFQGALFEGIDNQNGSFTAGAALREVTFPQDVVTGDARGRVSVPVAHYTLTPDQWYIIAQGRIGSNSSFHYFVGTLDVPALISASVRIDDWQPQADNAFIFGCNQTVAQTERLTGTTTPTKVAVGLRFLSDATLPTVETLDTPLTGRLTNRGNAPTALYMEYSTSSTLSPLEVILDQAGYEGSVPYTYSSSVASLASGTTYYYRARAINDAGQVTGVIKSFTTPSAPAAPTIISATPGAGSATLELAFPSPSEVTNVQYSIGGGTWVSRSPASGSSTLVITGLTDDVTYSIQVRSVNQGIVGSASNAVSVTPGPALPTVTTASVGNISTDSAALGGNVTADGGAQITGRGVVVGTSVQPTLETADFTSMGGAATGAFDLTLSGLSPGVTYFARAYATNSQGTSYGDEVSFTTLKLAQSITFNEVADRLYSITAFSIEASATSALTVSLSSATTSVCTVSGMAVTMESTGTCMLTASQGGNDQYLPADPVVQSFEIAPRVLSLSGLRVYDGTNLTSVAFLTTVNGLLGDQTLTLSGTATTDSPDFGLARPLNVTGITLGDGENGGVATNYTLDGGTHTITIDPRPVRGAFNVAGRLYDGSTEISDALISNRRLETVAGQPASGLVSVDGVLDDVALIGGTATLAAADADEATPTVVTLADAMLAGSRAANYVLDNPEITQSVTIMRRPLNDAAISVDAIADQTVTTEGLTPAPLVRFESAAGEVVLVQGTDYSIGYENNVAVGIATITVVGLGNFSGQIQQTFEIEADAPVALRLTGPTSNLTAGSTRNFAIELLDQFDNVVVADSGRSVTLSQSAGAGSLTGLSAINTDAGTATLTVTGNRAGQITLTASASGLAVDSLSFEVVPDAANQLALSVGPQLGEAGLPLAVQPVIEVRDGSNNRVNTAATITASLLRPEDDAASLLGTVTTNASNGLAIFTDLELIDAGLGPYQLRFESTGLVAATSAPLQAERYALLVFDGTGSGLYGANARVEVAADPAPDGQYFSGWLGDPDIERLDNVNLPNTTVTMPEGELGLVADYADIGEASYALSVSNGQGSGSYLPGQWVQVSTIAATGQRFVAWTGTGVDYLSQPSQPASGLFMPAMNVDLTPNFAPMPADAERFTLSVGNGQGSGEFQAGDVVAIAAATPPTGQRFDRWVGDVAELDRVTLPNASVLMPEADVVLTARYRPVGLATHTLTVVDGTGGGDVLPGQWVEMTAQAPDSGQVFDGWAGDVAFIEQPNQAQTRMYMPQRDALVAARYQSISPNQTQTLTVTDGSGDGVHAPGARVAVVADPAPAGQIFGRWVGDVATLDNPNLPNTTLTMPTRDALVAARYVPSSTDVFALTVTGGTGSGQYPVGDVIDIEASPPVGFGFVAWRGQVQWLEDPTSADTRFLMPKGNVDIEAVFAINQHTLTLTNGSGGGVYDFASRVSIAANPAPIGQRFVGWSGDVDALTQADRANTTVVMPDGPVTLVANYGPIDTQARTLTVTGGMGGGAYPAGSLIEIAALPAEAGAVFVNWTGDVSALSNARSPNARVVMPEGDVSVVANYAPAPEPVQVQLSVEGGQGSGLYARGRWVEISAAPAPTGGVFDQWQADDSVVIFNQSQANTRVFVREATTVSATYRTLPASEFALTVSGGNGSGNFLKGETIDVIAAPAASGSRFERWVGDTDFIDNPNLPQASFTMPARPAQLTAQYAPRSEVPVEVQVLNAEGSVSARPGTWVAIRAASEGSEGFARNQDSGAVFAGWEGDIAFVENPNLVSTYVWVPDRDITVAARFVDVSKTNNAESSVSVSVVDGSGSGVLPIGSEQSIVADAAPTGFVFDRWRGDVGFLANRHVPQTTLTVPDRDLSLSASYKPIPDGVSTIELTVEGGLGGGQYQPGSTQTIRASVPDGFAFVQWLGQTQGVSDRFSAQTAVLMPVEDLVLTAEIEEVGYPVIQTIEPLNGGSIVCTPDPVPIDGSVVCRATAAEYFAFDQWLGDCAGQTGDCTLSNVNQSPEVGARFVGDFSLAGVSLSVAGGAPGAFVLDQAALPSLVTVPAVAGLELPYGVIGFDLEGGAAGSVAIVTLTYPEPLPEGTRYWKFNPSTNQWFAMPESLAVVTGNQIVLTIEDGGVGDLSGAVNGRIKDPGGPGVLSTTFDNNAGENLLADVINEAGDTGLGADGVARLNVAITNLLAAVAGDGEALSLDDLSALGFDGLTEADLALVIQAMALTPADGSGLQSVSQIRQLIAAITMDEAEAEQAALVLLAPQTMPEVSDYEAAGVFGVTEESLETIQGWVETLITETTTTPRADVQRIVNAVNRLEALAMSGVDVNPSTALSIADYQVLGLTEIASPERLALMNALVVGLPADQVLKPEVLESVAGITTKITSGEALGTDELDVLGIPAPSMMGLGLFNDALAQGARPTSLEAIVGLVATAEALQSADQLMSVSAADLVALGVVGVTDGNLALVVDELLALSERGRVFVSVQQLNQWVSVVINGPVPVPALGVWALLLMVVLFGWLGQKSVGRRSAFLSLDQAA